MEMVKIESEQARIAITVKKYEHDIAVNREDANWLQCTMDFSTPTLAGSCALHLQTLDVERLLEAVEGVMQAGNSVRWENTETTLSVELQPNKTKGASVILSLKTLDAAFTELCFRCRAAYGDLEGFRDSLKQVVNHFPRRTDPASWLTRHT